MGKFQPWKRSAFKTVPKDDAQGSEAPKLSEEAVVTVREILEEIQDGWSRKTREVEFRSTRWYNSKSEKSTASIEESTVDDKAH